MILELPPGYAEAAPGLLGSDRLPGLIAQVALGATDTAYREYRGRADRPAGRRGCSSGHRPSCTGSGVDGKASRRSPVDRPELPGDRRERDPLFAGGDADGEEFLIPARTSRRQPVVPLAGTPSRPRAQVRVLPSPVSTSTRLSPGRRSSPAPKARPRRAARVPACSAAVGYLHFLHTATRRPRHHVDLWYRHRLRPRASSYPQCRSSARGSFAAI